MNHDERLTKLEQTLRDFRIVTVGLAGQFEYKLDKPDKANQSLSLEQRIAALEKTHQDFRIIGGANVRIEGSMKTGFCVNNTCEDAGGSAGFPEQIPIVLPTTGACCAEDGNCTIESETDCTDGGGTYQGDGTPCDPNPCGGFECGDSIVLSCSITASGTCDTGIEVTTTTPAAFSGTLIVNESISVDDAVVCLAGFVAEGSSGTTTCTAEGNGTTGFSCDDSLSIGIITVAGTINGNFYPVGTWLLFIPGYSRVFGALGACALCDTHVDPAEHVVSPDILNTISITQGGITSEFQVTFSFL